MDEPTLVDSGRHWLLVDSGDWPALYREYKTRGAKTWKQKKTIENQDKGETFIVAEFPKPVSFPSDVVFRSGRVGTYEDEDPVKVGVWAQESPAFIHYADEAMEEVKSGAAKLGKTLTGVLWGGAALGFAIFLARRK